MPLFTGTKYLISFFSISRFLNKYSTLRILLKIRSWSYIKYLSKRGNTAQDLYFVACWSAFMAGNGKSYNIKKHKRLLLGFCVLSLLVWHSRTYYVFANIFLHLETANVRLSLEELGQFLVALDHCLILRILQIISLDVLPQMLYDLRSWKLSHSLVISLPHLTIRISLLAYSFLSRNLCEHIVKNPSTRKIIALTLFWINDSFLLWLVILWLPCSFLWLLLLFALFCWRLIDDRWRRRLSSLSFRIAFWVVANSIGQRFLLSNLVVAFFNDRFQCLFVAKQIDFCFQLQCIAYLLWCYRVKIRISKNLCPRVLRSGSLHRMLVTVYLES